MKTRVNKRITLLLTGAACVLFCAETASADIVTFWKTDTCPILGGVKVAIASEVGVMQAAGTPSLGAGGVFCVLNNANLEHSSVNKIKSAALENSDLDVNPNDKCRDDTTGVIESCFDDGVSTTGTHVWLCAVCQYRDKITVNIPTISLLGTIILMAGLLTAAAYRIGKNQKREASA